MVWRAAVAGLEAATCACAALNFAYFLHRLTFLHDISLPRRVAAFVLALLSLGALIESAFVLVSISISGEASVLASGQWAIVRILPFAGMACMSALVLRAISNGK